MTQFNVPGGDPQARMKALIEQATAMGERARVAGEQISAIAVSASSRNRAVTVTAGSGGVLKSVTPGSASSGMSAAQICAAVMEAYARASRQAAQEASELMQDATGRDTRAMQMMRAALPPDPDAEDAGARR
ncbi:MAG TPA: YbaB/EbfC family nucleoid-associated protein [Jatrophihabitantaceae bacterium]|jgi:DNA-binding protein YbaB